MADEELVRLKYEVDLGVDHYHQVQEGEVDRLPKIECIDVEDVEETETGYIWPPVFTTVEQLENEVNLYYGDSNHDRPRKKRRKSFHLPRHDDPDEAKASSWKEPKERYRCPMCSAIVTSISSFWTHYSVAHEIQRQQLPRENLIRTAFVVKSCSSSDSSSDSDVIPSPSQVSQSCKLCRAKFATQYQLSQHILVKHPDPLQITCTEEIYSISKVGDGTKFRAQQILRPPGPPLSHPTLRKAEESYFCHFCKNHRMFRFNSEMRSHLKVYHKNLLESIPCEKCIIVSGSELLYRFHRLTHTKFWSKLNNHQTNQLEKEIAYSEYFCIKCPLPTCINLAPFTRLEDFEHHGHSIIRTKHAVDVNPNDNRVKHVLPSSAGPISADAKSRPLISKVAQPAQVNQPVFADSPLHRGNPKERRISIRDFFCHYCKYHREFRFNSEMRAHLVVYHKKELESIPCEECIVISGSELLYRFHRLCHTQFWLELNNSQRNQLEKEITFSEDVCIKCPLPTCQYLAPFGTLDDFEYHVHSILHANLEFQNNQEATVSVPGTEIKHEEEEDDIVFLGVVGKDCDGGIFPDL